MKQYFIKSLDISGKGVFKPYLCSRDIQVGDKVVALSGNNELIHSIVTDTHKLIETYKVIGEISPDAKWVKEGDEFDEDQVRRENLTSNPFGEADRYIKPLNDAPKNLGVRNEYGYITHNSYIKVKCPCCETFK